MLAKCLSDRDGYCFPYLAHPSQNQVQGPFPSSNTGYKSYFKVCNTKKKETESGNWVLASTKNGLSSSGRERKNVKTFFLLQGKFSQALLYQSAIIFQCFAFHN